MKKNFLKDLITYFPLILTDGLASYMSNCSSAVVHVFVAVGKYLPAH
jgi:hypothetical protein